MNLKKFVGDNSKIRINVTEIKNIDTDANLIGEFIAQQLEKRVAFKRATRQAIQKAQRANVQGIKVQVSGRLNGAEIARSEWVREGRVPLQTLRADIDYATKEALTTYGKLGIKVWVFNGELTPGLRKSK
jgi:small subunit ribosomal protein S3